ncbi:MAG: beta-galactosidase [Opitutaceae bacterium]|jgi:hypothetical protein
MIPRFSFTARLRHIALLGLAGLLGGSSWVCPLASGQPLPSRAEPLYLPLENRHYSAIVPGSALDFSSLVEPGPAGRHGFAQVRADGQMVFAEDPERPVRFLQATTMMMSWWPYKTQEQIDAFADQLVLNGYNLVRTHFLDQMLMLGSDKPGVFNPAQLEIFDRLTAALKKRGIYLYVDITTDHPLFDAFPSRDKRGDPLLAFKMYWQDSARQNWLAGAKALLEHVNPHTGVALKDEPQVVAFETRNEKGIHFLLGIRGNNPARYPDFLGENFRLWLKKKYATFSALEKTWTAGGSRPASLTRAKSFAEVGYPAWGGGGRDFEDFMRFVLDSERDLYAWQKNALRNLGVKVAVVDFNVISSSQTALVREAMDVVENHGYHDHPNGGPKGVEYAGATMANTSLLGASGKDFLALAGSRLRGKALFITEWGVPYWNEYRHEDLLFAPAYASFQGFSLLAHHGWPVALGDNNFIRIFHIFNDPTARAGERSSALLYLRGDVAPAKRQTTIAMDEKIAFEMGPTNNISNDLLRVGLVTGVSLARPKAAPAADLQFTPGRGAGMTIILGAAVNDSGGDTSVQGRWLSALRQADYLAPGNRTDVGAGLYESDTAELLLNTRAKTMTVETSRTVGSVLTPELRLFESPRLKVETDGTPVAVCASALDSQPLEKSTRILLFGATDSHNSGLRTHREKNREILDEPGSAPVLLRAFRARFSIKNENAARFKAWALREDGQRQQELPVTVADGWATFEIDTAALADGPVSYIELAVP